MKSVVFAIIGIGLVMLGFILSVYGLRETIAAGPFLEQKLATALGTGLPTAIVFFCGALALKRGFGTAKSEEK